MASVFTGTGVSFPMGVGRTGGLALTSGDDVIAESIRLILGTSPGERPMRPDFGCLIHDHIFEPSDATTEGVIAFEVERALRRWEPRIDLLDVAVTTAEDVPSLMYISIDYAVREVNDRRNLVFPFYVIPPEE